MFMYLRGRKRKFWIFEFLNYSLFLHCLHITVKLFDETLMKLFNIFLKSQLKVQMKIFYQLKHNVQRKVVTILQIQIILIVAKHQMDFDPKLCCCLQLCSQLSHSRKKSELFTLWAVSHFWWMGWSIVPMFSKLRPEL